MNKEKIIVKFYLEKENEIAAMADQAIFDGLLKKIVEECPEVEADVRIYDIRPMIKSGEIIVTKPGRMYEMEDEESIMCFSKISNYNEVGKHIYCEKMIYIAHSYLDKVIKEQEYA